MENNLYFAILEHLSLFGMNKYADITSLIQSITINPNSSPHPLLNDELFRDGYLNSMTVNGHIKYQKVDDKKEAIITPSGLKFLYDFKLTQSILATNKASRMTFIVVLLSASLTFVVASISAFISYKNYRLSERQFAKNNSPLPIKTTKPILQYTKQPNLEPYPKDSIHKR